MCRAPFLPYDKTKWKGSNRVGWSLKSRAKRNEATGTNNIIKERAEKRLRLIRRSEGAVILWIIPVKSKKLAWGNPMEIWIETLLCTGAKIVSLLSIVYLIFLASFFLLIFFNRKRFIREFSSSVDRTKVSGRDEWKTGIITFWNGAYGAISCFLNANWILRINSDESVRVNLLKWIYFCLVMYKYISRYLLHPGTCYINQRNGAKFKR